MIFLEIKNDVCIFASSKQFNKLKFNNMTQNKINIILKDVKFEIENIMNVSGSYNRLKNVMETINSIYSTDMEQGENVDNLMNKIAIVMALLSNPLQYEKMFSERITHLTFYAWDDMRKAMEFIDKL